MGHEEAIKTYISEAVNLKSSLLSNEDFLQSIQKTIAIISNCLQNGKKLLVAGNGGSAAEAQHFVAEIVSGYKNFERKGYPAVALTTNSSIITAWSNDHDFRSLFARQIEALGQSGDVFLAISTSGNSQNLIEGVKKAKEMKIINVCFLGRDGGKLKEFADQAIIVPHSDTPRIQEVHMLLTHIICEALERETLL